MSEQQTPKPGDALKAMMQQRADAWARLEQIKIIIDRVEDRCMAYDGPVGNTRLEMGDDELREIYKLAGGEIHE